jgi:hypothetical protein
MAVMVRFPDKLKEINAVFDAVDCDDPTPEDKKAFRLMLEKYPEAWRVAGDWAKNAASHMIDTLKAPVSLKISMERGWDALQDDLGAAGASPIEKLLIQQVVLSWMRLGYVEYAYTSITNGQETYERLNYWEKRLNAAQRRFLRASETLARVRKISLQAIQINIANQQVNVSRS